MNIKKAIILITSAVFSINLASCSLLSHFLSEEDIISLNQNKLCVEKAKKVFEAIKNHDEDSLIDLFCSRVNDTHDLKTEIAGMYEFLDGDIVSYDSISDPATCESIRDGKTVRLNGDPSFRNVETSNGHEYRIYVSVVLIYKDKDWEGVTQIGIFDYDSKDVEDYYQIGEQCDY